MDWTIEVQYFWKWLQNNPKVLTFHQICIQHFARSGSKMVISLNISHAVYLEITVDSQLVVWSQEKIYLSTNYQICTVGAGSSLQQFLYWILLQKTSLRGSKNLGDRSAQNSQKDWDVEVSSVAHWVLVQKFSKLSSRKGLKFEATPLLSFSSDKVIS
jgi:hypothetical protein